MRIALIQTGSWGDNINSTLMLQPLLAHFGATIDVHTTTLYGSAFHHNPHIHQLIEHPATEKMEAIRLGMLLQKQLVDYDLVLFPHPFYHPEQQFSMRHREWGQNLVYAWVYVLEKLQVDYTLPLTTELYLTPEEVARVDAFIAKIPNFDDGRPKNLMEVEALSNQSFWDSNWTNTVVTRLCQRGELVFISSKRGVPELAAKFPQNCYNANTLTIRECAELFNRCDKFWSVSSGLSNACNTNWCKHPVPWWEVVQCRSVNTSPIRSEGKKFWYDHDLAKFLKAAGL